MAWVVEKCSAPDTWTKRFETEAGAVDELRRHICMDCLAGSPGFLDDVVDFEFDGQVFECRDASMLLGTPCGCEFEINEVDENIHGTNPANVLQTANN